MRRAIALSTWIAMAGGAYAQGPDAGTPVVPPPAAPKQEILERITLDGRIVAATWLAGAVARRQLHRRQQFDRSRAKIWVTLPSNRGWLTVFGRTQKGRFDAAYAYWSNLEANGATEVEIKTLPPVAAQIRAVEAARRTVGPATELGPLTPVLVETAEQLVVYLIQEPKDGTVFIMGGDHRLSFDKEGKTLQEHRKLHKGALVVPRPKEAPPPGTVLNLFHNHVVGMEPLPTDTDVAFAIANQVDLTVASPTRNVFQIAPDGTITVEAPAAPSK